MAAVLAPLLDLPDVAPAMSAARAAVDAALRRRGVRSAAGPAATGAGSEAALRSAVASAALEGHPFGVDEVRAGTVTDPVLQGALRCNAAVPQLAAQWTIAPRQVLARLHLLAARGCPGVPVAALGQPERHDPHRLDLLCSLVLAPAAGVPAVLRAAVVHAELMVLRPFAGPNGVVARAAGRLTLIADGLDPGAVITPDVVHHAREPEYVGSLNAYATGTPDGIRAWLRHVATAVGSAAESLDRPEGGG
jgi:hypothetical protein